MLPSCTACINHGVNFIYILTICPEHIVWKELEMFFIIVWLRVFCSQALLLEYRTQLWHIFHIKLIDFLSERHFWSIEHGPHGSHSWMAVPLLQGSLLFETSYQKKTQKTIPRLNSLLRNRRCYQQMALAKGAFQLGVRMENQWLGPRWPRELLQDFHTEMKIFCLFESVLLPFLQWTKHHYTEV